MTSTRDIDVAYVLEDLPGVHAVFAIRRVPAIEYAIHVDDGYSLVSAHYALLRVLTHAECSRVELYRFELPAVVRENGTPIVLSASQRSGARSRVPLSSPALEQPSASSWKPSAKPRSDQLSVLVVDDDPAVEGAVREAFGPECHLVIVKGDPLIASWEAQAHRFDLVLCDVNRAFGERGFVSNLALQDRSRVRGVVLLALPRALSTLDEAWFTSELMRKPLTTAGLRAAMARGAKDPIARPRSALPSTRRRVLLIDEAETGTTLSKPPFTMTVVHDAWAALDLIHQDWALVVCSLKMETDTGARLYSSLWKVRPEIKSRFALLVDHPDDSNRVLTRPLTALAVTNLLDRIAPSRSTP